MKQNSTLAEAERQLNMVLFRLEKQTYGIPIEQVQQIIEMVTITPIPQVNHSVTGVINFHGATVPVVNLRKHLGMPEMPPKLHTPIILVKIGGRMIGLLVDEVQDVQAFIANQLINPHQILPDELGNVSIILGMVQSQRGMVIALDLEHLFLTYDARAIFQAADVIQQTTEVISELEKHQGSEKKAPENQNTAPAMEKSDEKTPKGGKTSKKASKKG